MITIAGIKVIRPGQHRHGEAFDLNEERTIDSIRYKISNAFTLNGGFGKNFKCDGESVALYGIQWGIDFGSSLSLNPN